VRKEEGMKLFLAIGASVLAVVFAAPALAAKPATNPWPGKGPFLIAFYVETVTAAPGESVYKVNAPAICAQTNFFTRGERIVWHVTAINTADGKIVEPPAVRFAYLKVPGVKNIRITYVPHGKDPKTSPWTWNARWDVPLDYPLGVVPFKVVFKLKGWPGKKVATFTQMPLALENLTIVEKRPQ
jgi:hypothetical protein